MPLKRQPIMIVMEGKQKIKKTEEVSGLASVPVS